MFSMDQIKIMEMIISVYKIPKYNGDIQLQA